MLTPEQCKCLIPIEMGILVKHYGHDSSEPHIPCAVKYPEAQQQIAYNVGLTSNTVKGCCPLFTIQGPDNLRNYKGEWYLGDVEHAITFCPFCGKKLDA